MTSIITQAREDEAARIEELVRNRPLAIMLRALGPAIRAASEPERNISATTVLQLNITPEPEPAPETTGEQHDDDDATVQDDFRHRLGRASRPEPRQPEDIIAFRVIIDGQPFVITARAPVEIIAGNTGFGHIFVEREHGIDSDHRAALSRTPVPMADRLAMAEAVNSAIVPLAQLRGRVAGAQKLLNF